MDGVLPCLRCPNTFAHDVSKLNQPFSIMTAFLPVFHWRSTHVHEEELLWIIMSRFVENDHTLAFGWTVFGRHFCYFAIAAFLCLWRCNQNNNTVTTSSLIWFQGESNQCDIAWHLFPCCLMETNESLGAFFFFSFRHGANAFTIA